MPMKTRAKGEKKQFFEKQLRDHERPFIEWPLISNVLLLKAILLFILVMKFIVGKITGALRFYDKIMKLGLNERLQR